MSKPIEVDILKVMDMIEKEYKSPAKRWKILRELIEKQKAVSKAAQK